MCMLKIANIVCQYNIKPHKSMNQSRGEPRDDDNSYSIQ